MACACLLTIALVLYILFDVNYFLRIVFTILTGRLFQKRKKIFDTTTIYGNNFLNLNNQKNKISFFFHINIIFNINIILRSDFFRFYDLCVYVFFLLIIIRNINLTCLNLTMIFDVFFL